MRRVWISHHEPRVISIDGQTLLDQLLKDQALDHETCSLAVRRLAQLDEWVHRPGSDNRSRILLEPDFAVSIIDPLYGVPFQRNHTSKQIISCAVFAM
jgi:hypothetical protein